MLIIIMKVKDGFSILLIIFKNFTQIFIKYKLIRNAKYFYIYMSFFKDKYIIFFNFLKYFKYLLKYSLEILLFYILIIFL